jgi:hypothetical protein
VLTTRTIKALERAGATVTDDGATVGHKRYSARFGSWVVEWIDQAGDVECLRARRVSDRDESQSDYSAGSWFDAVRPCIDFAKRMAHEDANGINRRPGFVCPTAGGAQ